MENDRIKVALLWGGRGRESEVSARGKDHILPLIDQDRYDVLPIFIHKDGRWLAPDGEEVLVYRGGFYTPRGRLIFTPDCVLPLLHGDFGEDGRVQGALDCADIPFVGCGVSAGAICRDKAVVKMLAASLGIPTLPFVLALRPEGMDFALRSAEDRLDYPMIVKPTSLGSSVGVGVAKCRDGLTDALTVAFALSDRVIIEPYLCDKRELECGYFSTKGKEIFTNPGEILLSGLYGYNEKYLSGDVSLALRADIPADIAERVRDYSRRLVRAVGVRQLARVDFLLSGEGLYFNEINTMPGFTDGSLYAMMLEGAGITESRLLSMLIDGVG